jgi:GAF domain-containing protein
MEAEDWFVSDGDGVIGPISMELVARGVASEKVPLGAFVRRADWTDWQRVGDVAELHDGETSGLHRSTLASALETIATAPTVGEAALYLLSSAVAHVACEGGLVHLLDQNGDALRTSCAHGPSAADVLGAVVWREDLAVSAVERGEIPDEWARGMTCARLRALGVSTADVIVVPIRAGGATIGMLEIGGRTDGRPYSAGDVTFVERLACSIKR